MKISFLGQGFEPESVNSVGNILLRLFKDEKFNSFYGISAFASVSAIRGLTESILNAKSKYQNIALIVGVDQEGTSKEALEQINSLGIFSFVYYQKESPIFHPKIYLFEGENDTALIIGSSNFTGRGLFSNIESSLFVEFENSDIQGSNLILELKTYFRTLFDFSDSNLFEISQQIINDFVDEGIVPEKSEWIKKYKKNTSERHRKEGTIFKIPSRKTSRIPASFKGIYKSNPIVETLIEELEIPKEIELIGNDNYEILWESNPLSERDLNIPTGANTNPTGSMLFKKGKTKGIDQRHYFRDSIFSGLDWQFDANPATLHLERAALNIRIIIIDIDYGVYALKLTHNSKKDTVAYIQNNSMTQISWGEAKDLIRDRELIGKTLFLLKNKETGEFIIDIK